MGVHRVGRRAATGLAAAGLMALAGCSDATPLPDVTAACAAQRLSVAVDLAGVRVTNTSATSCAFAGRYPVELKVWRLDGPGPPPAVGELAAGATYVQPYIGGPGNGCPAVPDGVGRLTVRVEGTTVLIAMAAQRVHEIQDCISFTAGPPRIEPGPGHP